MTDHTSISPAEAADRLAIRELVDAYAFCADRRDAEGQKALFTDDTHFVVYMAGEGTEPTDDLHGRESLTPVFDNLNTYEVTMHFNGQSTVVLDGDRATGETYCLAHHVYSDDGERKLMIAALRYQRHLRQDGRDVAVRRAPALRASGPRPALSRRRGLPDAHRAASRPLATTFASSTCRSARASRSASTKRSPASPSTAAARA